MIRLYFYVEGETEQRYAESTLRSHLAAFDVMVEGAVLAATSKRHGVVYRGGGRHYAPLKNDLLRLLRQQRGPEVRVTTMFDLYGLCRDFPGTDEADKLKHVPQQRVKALENAFGRDIGDARLLPHIQLHEFETILFCDPEAFAYYFNDCSRELDALRREAGELLATPERVNDSQQSAPSKRIARQFPDYPRLKPIAPFEIASIIDLSVIRSKCPHFNEWLTALEQLGGHNDGA
ncbi:MAG TPA: DUF4276 family protein [Pirellulales bacterium]|nr:DUF4276 family protein [Pirellulales bacterium]